MITRSYHNCGNLLWTETKGYGTNIQFTKFYNGYEDAPIQRIRTCPLCQQHLAVSDLEPLYQNKKQQAINNYLLAG